MPTILRVKGYQFYFYAHDVLNEPPHVHVAKAGADCKFWLEPIGLAVNHGFRRHELKEIAGILGEHHGLIMNQWNEYFGPQS